MAQAKGITLPIVYKSDPKGLQNASKQLGGFRKNLGKIGGALAAAFSVAAIGNFTKDAVGAASDLEESLNAVRVSFGDAAGEISALGETAADRLGLSQTQFNEIATQFSAFGEQIAGPGGDVVDVIDQISQRGADFASVFNLDVNDALLKFQSGLAGETEPLRKFGIDLSAAAVEAYAYENGIADAGAALTESQKIQARYGSLLEQTNKVQGDFANTSDGLANSQRILKANFADVQAEIGGALVPVFAELSSALIPVVKELAPVLAEVFEELSPIIADLAGELPGLFEALVPLLPTLGELAGVFLELINLILPPLVDLLNVIIPLFSEGLGAALEGLADILPDVSGVLAGVGDEMLQGLLDGLDLFWATFVEPWIKNMPTSIDEVLEIIEDPLGWLSQVGKDMIAGFQTGVEEGWVTSETWLRFLPGRVAAIMRENEGELKLTFGNTAEESQKAFTSSLDRGFMGITRNIVIWVFQVVRNLQNPEFREIAATAGVQIIDSMGTGMKNTFFTVLEWIAGLRAAIAAPFIEAFLWLFEQGKQILQGLWDGMVNIWEEDVIGWFETKKQEIQDFFSNPLDILFQIGKDIFTGLWDGFKDIWPSIKRWVDEKVQSIKDAFKDAMKIFSPSRVFEEYGRNIMQGLLIGLDSLSGDVDSQVSHIIEPGALTVPDWTIPSAAGIGPMQSAGPTYTVNIQTGVGDPVRIGEEVVNSIRRYERASGKVFASA